MIHSPDFVRYGSKPYREIEKYKPKERGWWEKILNWLRLNRINEEERPLEIIGKYLRSFAEAVVYPPNQAFIGNIDPEELRNLASPWLESKTSLGPSGKFGEILSEEEFYIALKIADAYDVIWLEESFVSQAKCQPWYQKIPDSESQKIGNGKPIKEIENELGRGKYWTLPLFHKGKLVGCFRRAPDDHAIEDDNLGPHLMMEDLITKASGALALEKLLEQAKLAATDIDFVISGSEEAIGDRYNRGGGSMAKAIAEVCGCENATGPDVKAFCAGPIYAAILGASLVKAGVCKNVAIVGGGCLAKIGMKYQGHVAANMPILEDMLGSIAFLISENDFESPVIRLDSIGKCDIKNGTSQQAVMESLTLNPLKKLGMKLSDVDKFAVELHNPEITIPSKTGDVPRKNYEMIAALAVKNKEITRDQFEDFIKSHGMPGFAPTQGHIPAGIPFLGHAISQIKNGKIKNAMFIARGSLFLGRMSHLYDGASFLLEQNKEHKSE